jgi:raffinose/stachyose/melibiose transport system substrate-binding protein
MIMDATAQFSIYEDGARDDWGYFRFPSIEGAAGDPGMNTGGAEVYAVSSASKNKEAAVRFLKFMTTKEQAFKQTKESGLPNCIVGGITPENGSDKLIGALEIVNSSITNVADWRDTAVDSRVADQYMSSAQECLSGKSAQEAMNEVNAVAKTVRESMK